MKLRITLLALAVITFAGAKATTPATWSVVATGIGSEKGEVAWADFNNDGYLDLFEVSNNAFALYKNNGNETFTNVASSVFPTVPGGVQQVMVSFFDYNNDGNLDLVISGTYSGDSQSSTVVYKNSGAPNYTYTIDTNNSLVGMRTGGDSDSHKGLSAVDYNNDGWVDLFMEGRSDPLSGRVATLYKNNHGTFERQTAAVGGTADFAGMNGGSLHTGDVNNDGYADVLTTGYGATGYESLLYINQGDGTFVKSSANFPGIEAGESIFFDANHDGWLDVFVAGVTNSGGWSWPGNLYLNNQDGTFTLTPNTNLPSGTQGYTAFDYGDINNDGKTDLFVMVPTSGNSAMFYNNGDNTFLKDIPQTEGRARAGSLQLADFNNDNKLDYFVFGWRDGYTFPDNTTYDSNWIGTFVKNNSAQANQAPSVPTNVAVTQVDGKYRITWNKSTDDITPQNTLRYNLFVTDQAGKVYVYSPADITTGRLKAGVPTLLYKNEFLLDLPNGTYTVGVQAVDQANVASAFATVAISETTGVDNKVDSGNITANAANGYITVANNGAAKTSFSLVALNGKTLYSGVCEAGFTFKIPTRLGQGVYVVKFSSEGKGIHKKVSVY